MLILVFINMSMLYFIDVIQYWYSLLNVCESKESGSCFICVTSRSTYK